MQYLMKVDVCLAENRRFSSQEEAVDAFTSTLEYTRRIQPRLLEVFKSAVESSEIAEAFKAFVSTPCLTEFLPRSSLQDHVVSFFTSENQIKYNSDIFGREIEKDFYIQGSFEIFDMLSDHRDLMSLNIETFHLLDPQGGRFLMAGELGIHRSFFDLHQGCQAYLDETNFRLIAFAPHLKVLALLEEEYLILHADNRDNPTRIIAISDSPSICFAWNTPKIEYYQDSLRLFLTPRQLRECSTKDTSFMADPNVLPVSIMNPEAVSDIVITVRSSGTIIDIVVDSPEHRARPPDDHKFLLLAHSDTASLVWLKRENSPN